MATLLLSAAGAALGGSLGGSVAGIATGALGKAMGATLGAVIDQRLTGVGSEPVEAGRVERFQVMAASEGDALARVFGRARVAGQIVWSSRFLEDVDTRRVGGKGGGGAQRVREYSYSISLAVALCEGEAIRVGRIWADGQELDLTGVVWRLHPGGEDQLPDPLIAAIEGAERAPAYRGVAYLVFENLELGPFGNRIPQINVEVFRRPELVAGRPRPPALDVQGVALVPGTGEYSLATTPVHLAHGRGRSVMANVNNDRGAPDLVVSLEQMRAELPAARAVSLVVSWFGDDLRCGDCRLEPAVEQAEADGRPMPWRAAGVDRTAAKRVSRVEDRPVFGGTPADAAVIEAIRHMAGEGLAVMFYPFILMDIRAGNGRPDPWALGGEQSPVPWRGRITLSVAPGQAGSPDRTPAAAAEVAAFFGAARAADFAIDGDAVVYAGPAEWSYRRFILHYAHLCALAGGVDAFCIGSEMRSLTQIRDGEDSYPAVRALCALAEDVRAILGPTVKIGYAADWSEYFGHHPADGSGDAVFHLDPLWAHPAIDFVGIDNYMPLSDWRDGSGHADEAAGSIYDLDYLRGNVAGGEGFDWHYADADARARQERAPIADGAHGEPWVFRYKDIRNWWSRPHHDRVNGVRRTEPTAWVPGSKPVWFTELGCPAVDKGTNQPNVFHDPKSVESFFPYFSTAARDDYIQQRYLQAVYSYWAEEEHNPLSTLYGGRMVELSRAFVWAWDARPWPDFPDRMETWSDGDNYARGHWINARLALPALAEVVGEICGRAGAEAETNDLHGAVTGYRIGAVESARQSLQPLMLVHGFDSFADEGRVVFAARQGRTRATLTADDLAVEAGRPALSLTREAASESPGRIELGYVRADAGYQSGLAAAAAPERAEPDAAISSVPVVLTDGAARAVAERWLSEAMVARDVAEFQLPPSRLALAAGDVVALRHQEAADLWRIDRVEEMGRRPVSAVRIEPGLWRATAYRDTSNRIRKRAAAAPADVVFLELPLLSGAEAPHAPHVAVAQSPWTGPLAVYSAARDVGYAFARELTRPAAMGMTLDPLARARAGAWSRQALRVRLFSGALGAAAEEDVLDGANAAALRHGGTGDWEVLQFAGARLVAEGEYLLDGLLRGQAGTDGIMADELPAGTDFVLLDAAVVQVDLPASARGLDRHFRVGPAALPYSHPSYVHGVERLAGVGLRPYRPTHLAAGRDASGDLALSWIRRTRVDGDSWEGTEAPLGEERELYHLQISVAGGSLREIWSDTPFARYSAAEQLADGAPGRVRIQVAQVSDRFGQGPYAAIDVDLA